MTIWAEKDRRALYESKHDLANAADPTAITAEATFHPTLTLLRGEYAAAREALLAAVRENARESEETRRARDLAARLGQEADDHWRYAYGKVHDHLLNLPPGTRMDAREVERRQRLFDRLFPETPAAFARLAAPARKIALLQQATAAMAEEAVQADLRGLGELELDDSLGSILERLDEAETAQRREGEEDKTATLTLDRARQALNDAAMTWTLQLEAILRREGRSDELGRFILSRNSAYNVRRRGQASLDQEPGIGEVDDEIDRPVVVEPPVPT